MKKILTLLSLTLCASIYAQKDKSYHNHWRESNDNNIKLHTTEFIYSEKGMFYYYFSNDRENLYINLRIFNSEVKGQVLSRGLTIWIDTKGKKARKLGIKYPIGMLGSERSGSDRQPGQNPQNLPDNQPRPSMSRDGAAPSGNRNIPMPSMDKLELIGFSESGKEVISSFINDNFRGSVKLEKDGNMWYELIMPFSKLPEMVNRDKNGEIIFSLGIAYESAGSAGQGGSPEGGQGISAGGGPGGRPGGGGGRPGGGMSGGAARSGGGSGPSSDSSSPTIIWLKDIRLAAQK